MRQAVVSQIEEKQGSGVLLIFEGYNELSPNQLLEDSIFMQLLKRKVIPATAIMVTSRPLATSRLPDELKRSACLQHVDGVMGFRREDINDYMQQHVETNSTYCNLSSPTFPAIHLCTLCHV